MAKLLYEVSAAVGTYKDRDGNEKTAYKQIGVVLQTEKSMLLKLETVPVKWEGWAYLNEPKPKDAERAPKAKQDDDSPPF